MDIANRHSNTKSNDSIKYQNYAGNNNQLVNSINKDELDSINIKIEVDSLDKENDFFDESQINVEQGEDK